LLAHLARGTWWIEGGSKWTRLEQLLISHRRGEQTVLRSQFRAGESSGKARTIDPLLVFGSEGHHRLQAADPAQYPSGEIRVHPYPLPLSGTKRRLLFPNLVGHP